MLFTIVFILTSPVRTQVYVSSEILFRQHGTIQDYSFINTITKETMKPYTSQLNENVNELINIPRNPFGLTAYMYGVLFGNNINFCKGAEVKGQRQKQICTAVG